MDFNVPPKNNTLLDSSAERLIPLFGAAGFSQPFWYVSKITKRMGSHASSAFVECPTANWGGVAPLIAGSPNGPLANCKGMDLVKVMKAGTCVFRGSVVVPDEDYDKDGACIECLSAMYLLEGVIVKGSFWIEDEGSSVCYREAVPAWFNKNGLPNRIKGENGLTYAFCETNYGILDYLDGPADPAVNSPEKASHWDPASVWTYLSETKTNSGAIKSLVAKFPEYSFLPDDIIVPKGAASKLTTFQASNENATIGLRKAAEKIFDCTPLNLALEDLAGMAGPWTISETWDSEQTTIGIVPSKNIASTGTALERASGPAEIAFAKNGTVIGGGVRKDFTQTFTEIVEYGDQQYVETRVASSDKTTLAAQAGENVELLTAWNPEIVKKIISDYNDAVEAGTPVPPIATWISQYPLVFEAWRLHPSLKFNGGTSEADIPLAKTTARMILPHLLTVFNANRAKGDDTKTGDGKKTFDLLTQPLPIWLEISDGTIDAPFTPGPAQPAPTSDNGSTPPASGNKPPDDGTADNPPPYAGDPEAGYEPSPETPYTPPPPIPDDE